MITFTREMLNGVSRLAIRALGGPSFPYTPRVKPPGWDDEMVILAMNGPSNINGAPADDDREVYVACNGQTNYVGETNTLYVSQMPPLPGRRMRASNAT